MKQYEAAISWRPDINSPDRVSKTFPVTARSQGSAVFQAAYKLGHALDSYLPGSENVTVRYIRSLV